MISALEFYNENLITEDVYDEIKPFRIFKIKDYNSEPVPVVCSEEWINSIEIFPRKYEVINKIYESEFIKVKLCRNLETNELVAIKFIRILKDSLDLKTKNRHDRIEREISIIQKLNHSYIIGVKEVIKMIDCVAIVMEYAKNGELFEYVKRRQRIPESVTKKLMFQIFLAVDNMHANGIVHRDLKLENILLDGQDQIKIADFGFANYWNNRFNNNEELVLSLLKTSCGSPCYAAPEIVLNNKGYNGFQVDIWSCGVIMFAMLFGYLPFEDQALKNYPNYPRPNRKSSVNVYQLYQYISRNSLDIPKHVTVSAEAIDLIKGMLRSDPDKRITLSEVFRHSWFANSKLS